jgi:hypothetical protein
MSVGSNMHYLGVAVIIVVSLIWVIGGLAIMRPRLSRPKAQSLISMLRPSPISFKDFTQSQKRRLIGLILTTIVLTVLGLGLIEGAFD